jgi:hypothetical protein
MLTAFLIVLALVGGIWAGCSEPSGVRSALKFLGLGAGFFLAAIALYGWQCDRASIPDILLFRDVPGQYFCSGRLTLVAYMLMLAALDAVLRAYITGRAHR